MKIIRRLCSFLLVSAFIHSASGTAIEVIRTPDGFWVGSDGRRGRGQRESSQVVCKIHETKLGLVGKGGALVGFTDTDQEYSLDKELRERIRVAESANSFRDQLDALYTKQIVSEIDFLLRAPGQTAEELEAHTFTSEMPDKLSMLETRNVFLIDSDGTQLALRQLMVFPASARRPFGGFRYYIQSTHWLKLDGTQFREPEDQIHPSLNQLALYVHFPKEDTWIQAHPREALVELLQQATKQYPDDVGPPFSIVHISLVRDKAARAPAKIRYAWIRRGKCPSWTDTFAGGERAKAFGNS